MQVYKLYIATDPNGAARKWLQIGSHQNFSLICRYARFFNMRFFHTKITDEDKDFAIQQLGNMIELSRINNINEYIVQVIEHLKKDKQNKL